MLRLEEATKRQVQLGIHRLAQEFAEQVEEETVEDIGEETLAELLDQARVPDFIPLFVYRYTRERILEPAATRPSGSGEPSVP